MKGRSQVQDEARAQKPQTPRPRLSPPRRQPPLQPVLSRTTSASTVYLLLVLAGSGALVGLRDATVWALQLHNATRAANVIHSTIGSFPAHHAAEQPRYLPSPTFARRHSLLRILAAAATPSRDCRPLLSTHPRHLSRRRRHCRPLAALAASAEP